MTIADWRDKCKTLLSRLLPQAGVPRDVVVVAVLVAASTGSFGLGYLAGSETVGQKGSVIVETSLPQDALSPVSPVQTGQVVASKNGTKYYLPSCSGADRISDANKVWFASVSAAVAAGYSPAANCKGI